MSFHSLRSCSVSTEKTACLVAQPCPNWFAILWTVTHQAPLSMGFPRKESWNVLPYPSPGDLPDPGIKPGSPALQADSYPLSHQGSPYVLIHVHKIKQSLSVYCEWCTFIWNESWVWLNYSFFGWLDLEIYSATPKPILVEMEQQVANQILSHS